MEGAADRFCRYVRVNTQADERRTTYPSSPGQLELGRLLVKELREMRPWRCRGGRARHRDGYHPGPTGRGRGGDGPRNHRLDRAIWILPRKLPAQCPANRASPATTARTLCCLAIPPKSPRERECPELAKLRGSAIITTDGTTLLGGDDKCGVAVIMETAAHLLAHPEIPHGPFVFASPATRKSATASIHVDSRSWALRWLTRWTAREREKSTAKLFRPIWPSWTITGINIHPVHRQGKMGTRFG